MWFHLGSFFPLLSHKPNYFQIVVPGSFLLQFLWNTVGHVWKSVSVLARVGFFFLFIRMWVAVWTWACACIAIHLHGNEVKWLILPQKLTFLRQVLLGLYGLLLRFWFCYLARRGFGQPCLCPFSFTLTFSPQGVQFYCFFIISLNICLWHLVHLFLFQNSCPD